MYRFTERSRNVKTGNIPVTTSAKSTCPSICPLKDSGCYADGGPLAIVWNQVSGNGYGIKDLCRDIESLPDGQLWRHNQAGDLPHKKQRINKSLLDQIVLANVGKRGFTYTHHDMSIAHNRAQVEASNLLGFTINLSGNNPAHADELADLGIAPVVTVLPIDQRTNATTPAGRKIVVCPAAIDDTNAITCKTCQLCAKSNRTAIIGFPAHGMRKKKADNIALQSN